MVLALAGLLVAMALTNALGEPSVGGMSAEDAAIVRCVVDCVGGQIPIIAGGGSNSTETSLMKSRTFRDCGVDGLLLITPY